MSWAEIVAATLFGSGAFFFLGGTVGLLRFPDVFTRLHALTKADNLGLGLIALGAIVLADSLWIALKILLVWIVVLLGSATSGYLVARHARRGSNSRSPPP
ncbi:cation:proton antiporter [Rubellimicrobium roseum]|uniref:Monovalent cation/H(+) antiporter subunit G n=1 Tax=Rubellimicrobium roseum TaxID=687525 RepID=A0A5C4NC44_9RHOB|nr:monovalent cation/H(+) antiporter subunit G [Rubellimicrobium roseum]TNC65803.1 monovalent cation/H(+) antiporter subunit G [Rubellimicrobium roseum]